ncbi:MAG: DUF2461 domain-containing protein [Deltaproteobacteria bacterium]|nr:DUF2461 domain-containing protein [Deltaproteobacteria bacterium]
MTDFAGFPREMVAFFERLKGNNRKEWFDEHRKDYEDYVKHPSEAFVVTMGKRLQSISPGIQAIPKINQSLFRINRDTRFGHDKRPYKTNLGIWFWEGARKRMECPGFYFHVGDGKLMLGAGMYIFTSELLKGYREAVVHKKQGRKLKEIVRDISQKGYGIGRKHYKRTPRGYDASHENAELLLFNGLTAMIENKIPGEFYSSAIVDYAFSHFKNMLSLHRWLVQALG